MNKNCSSYFKDSITDKYIYTYVNEMPSFKEKKDGEIEYILKFFIYPEQEEYQYTFIIQFIIDINGKVIGERIKDKSFAELTNAEKRLLKLIKEMPLWNPGKCDGKEVAVLMTIPLRINF